jgi:hypothetical protein
MSDLVHSFTSIALAIVGIGILAVLVSRNANTSNVLASAGNAFSGAIAAAEGPVLNQSAFHVGNVTAGPGFYG